jgi:hypothetical protein
VYHLFRGQERHDLAWGLTGLRFRLVWVDRTYSACPLGSVPFVRDYSSMGPRVTLFCVVALLMPAAAGAADITFSSFIAPSVGNGIAVGPGGDIFITGNTARSCMDGDVSVIRIAAGGTSFRYIATIRGSGAADMDECGYGIAVDTAGNAYVAGETNNTSFFDSANAAIPTTGCSALGDIPKAFVAKLGPDGSVTAVLCLIAGYAGDIALDGSGRVYVVGVERQPVPSTGDNAFVARVNSTFSGTDYLTIFGGTGGDGAGSVAVDAAGNVYVAGGTSSTDFPVLGGFQSAPGGQTTASLRVFRHPASARIQHMSAAGSTILCPGSRSGLTARSTSPARPNRETFPS